MKIKNKIYIALLCTVVLIGVILVYAQYLKTQYTHNNNLENQYLTILLKESNNISHYTNKFPGAFYTRGSALYITVQKIIHEPYFVENHYNYGYSKKFPSYQTYRLEFDEYGKIISSRIESFY